MNKEKFCEIIEEFLLPLFTGSSIAGEEHSSNRDAEVAQGKEGTILCKPHKTDEYRIIIRREQPFKKYEVQLARSVLDEIIKVYNYNIDEVAYNKSLQQYAMQKAICQSVNPRNYETLLDLVYELSVWATRTYEGNRASFGFIISPRRYNDKDGAEVHFSEILSYNFSAPLTDGKNSVMFLNGLGNLIGYINLPNSNESNTFAPIDLIKIARACKNGRIGIALIENGDLLIFNEQALVFAKSRGAWTCFSHEEMINKISDKCEYSLKEAIYLSSLDVAFARTGGCLCCLRKENEETALRHIDIKDILIEDFYNKKLAQSYDLFDIVEIDESSEKAIEYSSALATTDYIKVNTLRKMIAGKKFHELDRKFREELIGIDGATILDHEGNIIAVGAIVQIDAGSNAGGRLAATRTLAKYGVALKISMDSTIQCLAYDNKRQKVKTLFEI